MALSCWQVKGGISVTGGEGSIELAGIQYDLFIPADNFTAAVSGSLIMGSATRLLVSKDHGALPEVIR